MLSRKLGYLFIVIVIMSSILCMVAATFYGLDIIAALLIHSTIYFVVLMVFIIDIAKNPSVSLGWVWIILIILAPVVIMIVYTITYLPPSTHK